MYRLLTLNLHKGFSAFHRKDILDNLRTAIRASGADFVCLQEVLGSASQSVSGVAQYEFLADSIWSNFAYGKNAAYPEGHHGNAILSKLPIVSQQNHDISVGRSEKRGLLHVVLTVPDTLAELHVICVHLALSGSERIDQLEKLCDFEREVVPENAPLIVAGDFNDWRCRAHDPLWRRARLREAFVDKNGRAARSYPACSPFLPLDRIYTRNLRIGNPRVLSGKPWSRLSDHVPLSMDIFDFG